MINPVLVGVAMGILTTPEDKDDDEGRGASVPSCCG